MSMNDNGVKSLSQARRFTEGVQPVHLHFEDQEACYRWIAHTLKRFDYFKLGKQDKSTVIQYLRQVTGYTRQHITKLIKQYREHHWIGGRRKPRHSFPKKYRREDIVLLAEIDKHHQLLNGGATKKLLERAYTIYKDKRYERVSTISISHIYNLRKTKPIVIIISILKKHILAIIVLAKGANPRLVSHLYF